MYIEEDEDNVGAVKNSLNNDESGGHGYVRKTVLEYLNARGNHTYNYLMISEFIDNSISSFENRYGSDVSKWKRPLIINFGFLVKDENIIQRKVGNFLYKTYTDVSLYILDNAFGIDPERVRDALILDRYDSNSKSSKNRYGKGLKQAAFFFGMDLKVWTSSPEGDSKSSIMGSEYKSPEKDFIQINRNPWDKSGNNRGIKQFGTRVEISNIYQGKIIASSTSANIKNFIDSLSGRYGRYIASGNVEINFKNKCFIKDNLEDYEITESIVEKPDFHASVDSLWDKDNYGTGEVGALKFIGICNSKIQAIIDNHLANEDTDKSIELNDKYDWDVVQETLNKFKDLLLTKNLNDPVLWKQKFCLEKEYEFEEVEITFFKINIETYSKNYSKWSGITVYEGMRPIYHGPRNKEDRGTFSSWFPGSRGGGSTVNIFSGFFNLLDIDKNQILVKDDKSSFDLGSLNSKLDKFILSVWYCFDQIVRLGKTDEQRPKINVEKIKKNVKENFSETKNISDFIAGDVNISILNDSNKKEWLSADLFNVKSIAIDESGQTWNIKLTPYVDDKVKTQGIVESSKILKSFKFFKKNNTHTLELMYYPKTQIFKISGNYKDVYENVLVAILFQLGIHMINLKLRLESKNEQKNNEIEYDI